MANPEVAAASWRCGRRTLKTAALLVLVAALVTGCESSDGGGIAIVQYQVQEPDRIGEDADRLASFIRMAARAGARLVVTPETALHRYAPYEQGGVTMSTLAAEFEARVSKFSELAAELGITLIVGLREPAGGAKVYNTAVCFGPGGETLGTHRKVLPSLEEAGFTASGGSLTAFDTSVGRIGLAVCKDIYSSRVQAGYAVGSVDLFVLVAADPDGVALGDALSTLCSRVGCPGVLANQQIEAGNSASVSSDGSIHRFGGGEEIFHADLP